MYEFIEIMSVKMPAKVRGYWMPRIGSYRTVSNCLISPQRYQVLLTIPPVPTLDPQTTGRQQMDGELG